MATRMQQRRGTADQWLSSDPVLDIGEIGFETDTNSFKIGDGVNSWVLLDYFTNESGLSASLEDYILATEKAAANGVATLDANGFVPAEQLDIDLAGYATETYADTAAANAAAAIVDSSPAALDTLNELAAALGDDANFSTTVTNALANKQPIVSGVSDTEIGYLDGVTSAIQTQLDSKIDSSKVLLQEITAPSGQTITFSNIDQGYSDLVVEFADIYTSGYSNINFLINGTTSNTETRGYLTDSGYWSYNFPNATVFLRFKNYSSGFNSLINYEMIFNSGQGPSLHTETYAYTGGTAITSIAFQNSNASYSFVSGNIRLYGIR